jgi:hypothetical protein
MRKAFSYSAMKDFKGCARRYHSVKVLKQYPFVDTDATRYGKEVHSALENRVKHGTPLPEGLTQFEPTAASILRMPGTKYCELELAITEAKEPTKFLAKDVWVRGIIDVLIVDGDRARVLDYKGGSARYPDKAQLELMALLVFEHYPEVQHIKGALVFLHHNKLVKGVYHRSELSKLWAKWIEASDVLDQSFANNVWHPNPTALCRYCPCEHCEHWVR